MLCLRLRSQLRRITKHGLGADFHGHEVDDIATPMEPTNVTFKTLRVLIAGSESERESFGPNLESYA